MKSAIVVFPASNCDRDAAVALERVIVVSLAAIALLFWVCESAFAQEDTSSVRLALARELVVEGNERARLEAYAQKVAKESADELGKIATDIGAKPGLLTYAQYVQQELDSTIPDLMELHARFFAAHLSLQELQDWKAFMQTDTGEKLVSLSIQAEEENYPQMRKWVGDATDKAIKRMAAEEKERRSK